MLKPKTVTTYIFTYTMWVVSFLLWLWVMYLGRNLLTDVLNPMVMPGAVQQAKMVQLADRVYLMTMGLIWLVLMIVVENYFRRGVQRGEIWRRIGRVLGPQILLVFAVDLAMIFFYGPEGQPVSRWVILALEFILGIGLVVVAVKAPAAPRPGRIIPTK